MIRIGGDPTEGEISSINIHKESGRIAAGSSGTGEPTGTAQADEF